MNLVEKKFERLKQHKAAKDAGLISNEEYLSIYHQIMNCNDQFDIKQQEPLFLQVPPSTLILKEMETVIIFLNHPPYTSS